MGALNFDGHNVAALLASLILVFSLNLVWKVVALFIDGYKEKNKKTDQGIKELQEKIERKLDQFQGFLTSYIEETIRLSDKMVRFSDKMESTEKRLDDLMEIDAKLRRLNSAIKLIAGEEWPRIKKEITDEDFT
jgi:hypothetical protein